MCTPSAAEDCPLSLSPLGLCGFPFTWRCCDPSVPQQPSCLLPLSHKRPASHGHSGSCGVGGVAGGPGVGAPAVLGCVPGRRWLWNTGRTCSAAQRARVPGGLGTEALVLVTSARFRGFSASWPGVVVWAGAVLQGQLVLVAGPAVAGTPRRGLVLVCRALFDRPRFPGQTGRERRGGEAEPLLGLAAVLPSESGLLPAGAELPRIL